MSHIHYDPEGPPPPIERTPTYPMSIPMTRLKKTRKPSPTFLRALAARNSTYSTDSYSTAIDLSMEDFISRDIFSCKCCRDSLSGSILSESTTEPTSNEGSSSQAPREYEDSARYPGYDQAAFEAAWRRRVASSRASRGVPCPPDFLDDVEPAVEEPAKTKSWMKRAVQKVLKARRKPDAGA